ncbi:MAG TPA: YicC family protein [Syntrophales bacterium]|nr:YicC family protein [Syntrophales bacterium]
MKSMTGYGRAEGMCGGKKLAVEIRSLNHRYIEVSLRLPPPFFPWELEIKKRVTERFSRGKIEVALRMDAQEGLEGAGRLTLNWPLLRQYHALLVELKQAFNIEDPITLPMLAGLREVFVTSENGAPVDNLWPDLEPILAEAMSMLSSMRQREGEMLRQDMVMRLQLIQGEMDAIRERSPGVVLEYRARLAERVRELANNLEVDEGRLSVEVAIMADKMDITEELVRFASHVDQFHELVLSPDAVGRKIDFLIQELNREINTIGSKSADTDIARRVIDIKSELSKLREQVQNIE